MEIEIARGDSITGQNLNCLCFFHETRRLRYRDTVQRTSASRDVSSPSTETRVQRSSRITRHISLVLHLPAHPLGDPAAAQPHREHCHHEDGGHPEEAGRAGALGHGGVQVLEVSHGDDLDRDGVDLEAALEDLGAAGLQPQLGGVEDVAQAGDLTAAAWNLFRPWFQSSRMIACLRRFLF